MERRDLIHIGEGFLMGGADIIPGVSGGTMALILGVYERLVGAISHFDLTLLRLLRERKWLKDAQHVDLLFLVLLGCGVLSGILLLASSMHWLLENQLQHTYAAFFGMILASSYLVWRLIGRGGLDVVLLALVGAAGAYWLVGLKALENPTISPLYIFLCGIISICAMILPGISGSFILVLLGAYFEITGILGKLVQGEITEKTWLLLYFGAGAAIGLLGFSKILRWLLTRFEAATMALLFGFMLGSLRKIWPYKVVVVDNEKFELRIFENVLPDLSSSNAWISLGILIVAAGLVVLLEWLAQHRQGNAGQTPEKQSSLS
ncbi:MAG: DUF368 domain-containing protein [Planctomycetaceae bacterium]|nr:DUF368 domain-containing protein [Planctomycetaceae bacterium]